VNVDTGVLLVFAFVAFVIAGLFVMIVGQAQNTLENRLLDGGNNSALNEEGRDIVESQSSSFPSLFDTALVVVFIAIVAGYVWLSYLFGQPGLALIIGLIVLIVASFVGVTLSDVAVSYMEGTEGFASQFSYTKFLLENLMFVISGSVTASVVASALGGRGRP